MDCALCEGDAAVVKCAACDAAGVGGAFCKTCADQLHATAKNKSHILTDMSGQPLGGAAPAAKPPAALPPPTPPPTSITETKSVPSIPLCGLCEDLPSTVYCNNCDSDYCTDCSSDFHKPQKQHGHSIVRLIVGGGGGGPTPNTVTPSHPVRASSNVLPLTTPSGLHARSMSTFAPSSLMRSPLLGGTPGGIRPNALASITGKPIAQRMSLSMFPRSSSVTGTPSTAPISPPSLLPPTFSLLKPVSSLRPGSLLKPSPPPAASTSLQCSVCESDPATRRCDQCSNSFCDECDMDVHTTALKMGHLRRAITEQNTQNTSVAPTQTPQTPRLSVSNPLLQLTPAVAPTPAPATTADPATSPQPALSSSGSLRSLRRPSSLSLDSPPSPLSPPVSASAAAAPPRTLDPTKLQPVLESASPMPQSSPDRSPRAHENENYAVEQPPSPPSKEWEEENRRLDQLAERQRAEQTKQKELQQQQQQQPPPPSSQEPRVAPISSSAAAPRFVTPSKAPPPAMLVLPTTPAGAPNIVALPNTPNTRDTPTIVRESSIQSNTSSSVQSSAASTAPMRTPHSLSSQSDRRLSSASLDIALCDDDFILADLPAYPLASMVHGSSRRQSRLPPTEQPNESQTSLFEEAKAKLANQPAEAKDEQTTTSKHEQRIAKPESMPTPTPVTREQPILAFGVDRDRSPPRRRSRSPPYDRSHADSQHHHHSAVGHSHRHSPVDGRSRRSPSPRDRIRSVSIRSRSATPPSAARRHSPTQQTPHTANRDRSRSTSTTREDRSKGHRHHSRSDSRDHKEKRAHGRHSSKSHTRYDSPAHRSRSDRHRHSSSKVRSSSRKKHHSDRRERHARDDDRARSRHRGGDTGDDTHTHKSREDDTAESTNNSSDLMQQLFTALQTHGHATSDPSTALLHIAQIATAAAIDAAASETASHAHRPNDSSPYHDRSRGDDASSASRRHHRDARLRESALAWDAAHAPTRTRSEDTYHHSSPTRDADPYRPLARSRSEEDDWLARKLYERAQICAAPPQPNQPTRAQQPLYASPRMHAPMQVGHTPPLSPYAPQHTFYQPHQPSQSNGYYPHSRGHLSPGLNGPTIAWSSPQPIAHASAGFHSPHPPPTPPTMVSPPASSRLHPPPTFAPIAHTQPLNSPAKLEQMQQLPGGTFFPLPPHQPTLAQLIPQPPPPTTPTHIQPHAHPHAYAMRGAISPSTQPAMQPQPPPQPMSPNPQLHALAVAAATAAYNHVARQYRSPTPPPPTPPVPINHPILGTILTQQQNYMQTPFHTSTPTTNANPYLTQLYARGHGADT